MIPHSRDEVWPGQIPKNTNGTTRPKLAKNRPFYTIHYTGGGLWLDENDTPAELKSIQQFAQSAGKPWEYNYVIDGQGHVWTYAGEYQAAHSEGENALAIGVLLLVGLKDAVHLTGFEKPTEAMIEAIRDLRAALVASSALAPDHQIRKHKDMPGANTICPGPEVIARWDDITGQNPHPEPPTPPQEPDMEFAIWEPPDTSPQATFVGVATNDGQFLFARWVNGNNPEELVALQIQRDAGRKVWRHSFTALRGVWLQNSMIPVGTRGGQPWVRDDFGGLGA